MRIDRAVLVPLAIVASVLVLGVAIYSPLMVAWVNRNKYSRSDMFEIHFSWFMRRADFLYVPLTRFHASMCGYTERGSFPREGTVEVMIFGRTGPFDRE